MKSLDRKFAFSVVIKQIVVTKPHIVQSTIGNVLTDKKYPVGICDKCRKRSNPESIVDWSLNHVKVHTQAKEWCDCQICQRGR